MLPLCLLGLAACAELQAPGAPGVSDAGATLAAQPTIERAQIAYELGNYAEARKLYSELVAREPDNLGAALGMGETLLALGETDAAGPYLSRVVENSAGPQQIARAQLGLGIYNLRKGEIGRARTLLEKSTMAAPGVWRAWTALGHVYDRQKDYDAAARAYAQAERTGPGEARVYNDIGVSLMAQGKTAAAVEKFERALALDPDLTVARQNIRLAKARERKYTEALAGATEDELPAVLNNVGYVAILNRDYKTAESLLTQAARLSPYYEETVVANLDLLKSARGAHAN